MSREEATRDLLRDWVSQSADLIGEYSSNFRRDYGALVRDARERAAILGVAWDDALVPDYVRDTLRSDFE